MADNNTASLTVLGGPLAGTQCALPQSGTLTIGSSPDSSLYLDLLAVSPYHARVVVEGGRITVHDTGSSRTVHVNDNPIGAEGTELRNGDILWLGAPGDDDVVMLQCILPKRAVTPPFLPPGLPVPAATPTPEIETVALWATETATETPAETAPESVEEPKAAAFEAPVEDSVAVSAEEAAVAFADEAAPAFDEPVIPAPEAAEVAEIAETADEPELVGAPEPEVVTFAEETPAEVEDAPASDAYVVEDGEELAEVAPTLLMGSADEVADAVEEGYGETVSFAAPAEFTPETFEPAAEPAADEAPLIEAAPVEEPAAFEGVPEVELPALAASPEAAEPEAAAARPAQPPAAPPAAAKAPPAVTPPRPAESRPAAWQTTRQPPSASQRVSPSSSQRLRPRPAPAREAGPVGDAGLEPAPEPAASRRPMLLAVGGFVGVLALAGGGYLAWRTLGSRPAPSATPTPIARASEPPRVLATPEPQLADPTPEPIEAAPAATPALEPVDTQAAPAPVPTPRPTPTPRATPTPSAPTPPPAPSGPSPEQQRAQQAAAQAQALLAQADAALAARQYDAALSHADGALRLEPGNARASAIRADATQRRSLARRRFVAGRTVTDSEDKRKKLAKGGLVGFDADDKDPDFLGRIEFEMSPASGIEANDAWTLKVFVQNQGAKPIRVQGLSLATTVNGAAGGGPVPTSVREIAPRQRVLVGEVSGSWVAGTSAWVAEATLTAPKNETLKNTLTWK